MRGIRGGLADRGRQFTVASTPAVVAWLPLCITFRGEKRLCQLPAQRGYPGLEVQAPVVFCLQSPARCNRDVHRALRLSTRRHGAQAAPRRRNPGRPRDLTFASSCSSSGTIVTLSIVKYASKQHWLEGGQGTEAQGQNKGIVEPFAVVQVATLFCQHICTACNKPSCLV